MASDHLIVLVDMDMVICDFEQNFLKEFRNKYPDLKYVPLPKRVGEDPVIQYSKFGASYEVHLVFTKTFISVCYWAFVVVFLLGNDIEVNDGQ